MRLASVAPWLAFAALALAPAAVRAEEPAAPPSPADAAKKVRATFGEPSDKHAFAADLELLQNGVAMGSGAISAAPATEGAKKTWATKISLTIGEAVSARISLTAEADLRMIKEDRFEKSPEGEETTVAERTDKGLKVTFTKGTAAPAESVVQAPADVLASGPMTGVLFLRQCPAEAAKYEFTAWDGDKREVSPRTLEVKGAGKMKDAALGLDLDAFVAATGGGENPMEIYLDAKDRSFLGVRSIKQGYWIVKKGLVKPKDVGPVPDWKADAKSAKDVGIRFAMGILVGDLDAIGEGFDWPSMAAAVKEQMGSEMDPEVLKTLVLENIKANLKDMKPEQAWAVVKGAADGAEQTEQEGGVVKVKMGAPFQQVVYTAKEIDGKWLITGMERPQ